MAASNNLIADQTWGTDPSFPLVWRSKVVPASFDLLGRQQIDRSMNCVARKKSALLVFFSFRWGFYPTLITQKKITEVDRSENP